MDQKKCAPSRQFRRFSYGARMTVEESGTIEDKKRGQQKMDVVLFCICVCFLADCYLALP
jgi:tetrahydromethanopterin S-methyltransferase subunit E